MSVIWVSCIYHTVLLGVEDNHFLRPGYCDLCFYSYYTNPSLFVNIIHIILYSRADGGLTSNSPSHEKYIVIHYVTMLHSLSIHDLPNKVVPKPILTISLYYDKNYPTKLLSDHIMMLPHVFPVYLSNKTTIGGHIVQ